MSIKLVTKTKVTTVCLSDVVPSKVYVTILDGLVAKISHYNGDTDSFGILSLSQHSSDGVVAYGEFIGIQPVVDYLIQEGDGTVAECDSIIEAMEYILPRIKR